MQLSKLTQADWDILNATKAIVDGIAAMYGQHTEVVLHGLDIDDLSVIKIANGHVTGRCIGAPVTNLALVKLKTGQDISDAYFTKSPDGHTLRSVTTVIRNPQQQPIGLLCINTDIDAPLQSVLSHFLPSAITPQHDVPSPETFARSSDEMLHSTIDSIRQQISDNELISPSKKHRQMVTQLYHLGIFDLKDSAQITADRLDISIHSIYRYIRELKSAS